MKLDVRCEVCGRPSPCGCTFGAEQAARSETIVREQQRILRRRYQDLLAAAPAARAALDEPWRKAARRLRMAPRVLWTALRTLAAGSALEEIRVQHPERFYVGQRFDNARARAEVVEVRKASVVVRFS